MNLVKLSLNKMKVNLELYKILVYYFSNKNNVFGAADTPPKMKVFFLTFSSPNLSLPR